MLMLMLMTVIMAFPAKYPGRYSIDDQADDGDKNGSVERNFDWVNETTDAFNHHVQCEAGE